MTPLGAVPVPDEPCLRFAVCLLGDRGTDAPSQVLERPVYGRVSGVGAELVDECGGVLASFLRRG